MTLLKSRFVGAFCGEFVVHSLTLEMATRYSDRLVDIHNGIPNQRWTRDELLAQADGQREFFGKWDLSTYTSRSDSDLPIGFCVGFETERTPYFPEAGVYMHRTALLASEQFRGIGGIMHVETMVRIFQRRLQHVHALDPSSFPIFGQTSKEEWNKGMVRFWRDAGFEIIGEKPYPNRSDYVMRMTASSLTKSRHYRLWQLVRA